MRNAIPCGCFPVALAAAVVAAVVVGGCADPGSAELSHETHRAPIINGTVDTTHQAVVAVTLGGASCTGTIIHKSGSNAYVLTAGHCIASNMTVYQGNDWSNPDVTYPVVQTAVHPAYSGGLYDFGMLRITGATAATPVIPAQTPAEDALAVGTQVRHVGYGITWYPGGSTTVRHETFNVINSLSPGYFDYLQPTSGPCSGDSGGPALTVSGSERVAGVISSGDQTCSQAGVSGRVSDVYEGFILAFINNTPLTMTCNQCFSGATTGSGTCSSQVDTCFANADCDALVACMNGCLSQSCVGGCAADHPSGYVLYRAIFDCVCTTGCTTVCAGDDVCTRGLGEPCSTGSQCDSGFCADGVCCTDACTGQCEACDRPGLLGGCGAVQGVPRGDRLPCADDGSVCGGTCDGSLRSECTYPDEISPCRALGCVDGVATELAVCDGAGSCPLGATVSCAPYLCNGDVCATTCMSTTDCAVGFVCDGGMCVGSDCTGDEDCPGDLICRDGSCGEPDCRNDGDCPGAQVCRNGLCLEVECVVDADCSDGRICQSSTCVTPPSVSPSGCSCTSAGAAPPPLLPVLLPLLGLVWLGRRRRLSKDHKTWHNRS